MTRKDYIALAEALRDSRPTDPLADVELLEAAGVPEFPESEGE